MRTAERNRKSYIVYCERIYQFILHKLLWIYTNGKCHHNKDDRSLSKPMLPSHRMFYTHIALTSYISMWIRDSTLLYRCKSICYSFSIHRTIDHIRTHIHTEFELSSIKCKKCTRPHQSACQICILGTKIQILIFQSFLKFTFAIGNRSEFK